MSVSRRQFISAGAAAAAVGSISSFGLADAAKAASNRQGGSTTTDPFTSSDNFKPYVNTPFSLQSASGVAGAVTLTTVTDFRLPSSKKTATKSSPSGPGFSLTFDGSNVAGLPQGTYTTSHPSLGTFQMFIAPVGLGRDYQAVINRMN